VDACGLCCKRSMRGYVGILRLSGRGPGGRGARPTSRPPGLSERQKEMRIESQKRPGASEAGGGCELQRGTFGTLEKNARAEYRSTIITTSGEGMEGRNT